MIGDNPNGPGEVVLRIIGGMIVSASQTVTDPRGRQVEIDRTDRHPINGKDINHDEIEQVIRNPGQVWEGSEMDHYVRKINGKWVIVRVYRELEKISTAVVKTSKAAAKEYIENEWGLSGNRVYGPGWHKL